MHGPEPTGIVAGIVQCDAHGWSRRSLTVAGVTPSGGVELWSARLDDFSGMQTHAAPDDGPRALGIADALSRSRFLTARALLRRILAERLQCDPAGLRFGTSAHGKPVLQDIGQPTPGLHFNLSHAGGWLLIATRAAGPVGVDLEFPRTGVDLERLARRVFTPAERAALLRRAEDPQDGPERRFYDCWTRKEALLKCLGTGFAGGAAAFEVGVGREPVRVVTPGHGSGVVCVTSFAPPQGRHAAVAWACDGRGAALSDGVGADGITARWWLEPAS